MYKPIRSAELIGGGNVVKQGEFFTLIYQLFDEDGQVVALTGNTITVKIANKYGVVFESTAAVLTNGQISFEVNEDIGYGEMRIELTVTNGSTLVQKYPSEGWVKLDVTPSLDDLGIGGVNAVTVSSLKRDLQTQLDAVVLRETDSDAMSRQAAVDVDGVDKGNLKQRLDDDFNQVTEQLADAKQIVEDMGFNIRWNALMALNGDWTTAIQKALDNYTHVYVPKGSFPFTTLTVTKFGATINGSGQVYGESTLEYRGVGTAITVMPSVNYFKINNIHLKGISTVSTDFFNTGTIGINISGGATIVAKECWLDGFDSLVKSNYDSFYNKFIDCRFEKSRYCIDGFNINNFEVKGNRFERFHVGIRANGTNGVLTIEKNSFEKFNSYIVLTVGVEKGLVVFESNYVEIYDKLDLPTNFPNMEANGAKTGKYGGNILFGGTFGNLVLRSNEMQIGGVFRIVSSSNCDYLESTGNNIHIYTTGNNLDRMFFAPSLKSYYINDNLGVAIGADGGYSRAYTALPLNVSNIYNTNYYFDCILKKEVLDNAKIHTPALQNGWVNTAVVGYGGAKILVTKEGLHLQGTIDGVNQTAVVVFTLPASVRPFVQGTSKSFCNLTAFADLGAGNQIRFRYLYTTGELRMEGTPASKANISLDGLVIPMQI